MKRRIIKKFAFLPTFFGGKTIWLREYSEVREYRTSTGLLPGSGREVDFYEWVIIDKI